MASAPRPPWWRRFFTWLTGAPRLLDLSGEQRQTLMSWGLLGGVIAISLVKVWQQRELLARWKAGISPETESKLVEGLFWQLTWDTLLQAGLALGVVAIARGGSMAVSITKAGLSMDFQASGAAAKSLAQETSLASASVTEHPPAAAPAKPAVAPAPAPATPAPAPAAPPPPAADDGRAKPEE